MDLQQLRDLARTRLDDWAAPQLWSDVQLTDYANTAVLEACERARLIYDTSTASITQIAVVSGTRDYALHASIQRIDRAYFDLTDTINDPTNIIHQSLRHLSLRDLLDRYGSEWECRKGRPEAYHLDDTGLHFNMIPQESLTLKLAVYRRPLASEEMTLASDTPVIPAAYHRDLVHWMLVEAYSAHDSEMFDPKRTEEAEMKFTRRFGPRPSARAERITRETNFGEPMYFRRFGGN